MSKTQAPGFFRMMLGQVEVTALCDGLVELDAKLFRNATEAEIRDLLAQRFIAGPKIPTPVNAYVVNTGSKLVLLDTGGGSALGPAFGHLAGNMKAAGYEPAQVDDVLLTHLHGDHVGGLLDAAGKPAFPNATIHVSKAESDYWLLTVDPEKVPAEYRPHIEGAAKLARRVAAPYIALGRWKTFQDGEFPVAGVSIKAEVLAGHTPGHTVYEISSGGQTLLVVGDLIHSAAVQFPRPEVAVSFDSDPKQAVAVRQGLFRRAAENKSFVAGMHLPFPGIGRLRADGKGGYVWVPVEYSMLKKG